MESRLSKKQYELIEDDDVSKVQWGWLNRVRRAQANREILRWSGLASLIEENADVGTKSFGPGVKRKGGTYDSVFNDGLFKVGHRDKIHLYFLLCFWIIHYPDAPEKFFLRKIPCSSNFLSRKSKWQAVRKRMFEMMERGQLSGKRSTRMRDAFRLLASCLTKKRPDLPDIVKVNSRELNKWLRNEKAQRRI